MSLEDLLGALSDYLLRSGFQENMWYELPEGEQTMDALRRAIEQALLNGELFDEEMRDRLDQMQMEGELDELIEKIKACRTYSEWKELMDSAPVFDDGLPPDYDIVKALNDNRIWSGDRPFLPPEGARP